MSNWPKGSGVPAGGPGQGPARGYTWEPFQPGHEITVTHGASRNSSQRFLAPLAEALTEQLAEQAPWTSYPAFRHSVQAWAWAEARCHRYRMWAEQHDIVTEAGLSAGFVREWDRAESRAQSLRSALGLDPASLSKLLARASSRMSKAVGGGDEELLAALDAAAAALIGAEVQEGRRRAVEGSAVVSAERERYGSPGPISEPAGAASADGVDGS